MGRNRLLPGRSRAHVFEFETPHVALGAICIVMALVGSALFVVGRSASDAFFDMATLCSYDFVIVYGAIAVGASLSLQRRGELRLRNVIVSVVAVVLLVVPAVGSVYPVPPPPANWYPYAFLLYVACGVGLLWRRQVRVTDILAVTAGADGALGVTAG